MENFQICPSMACQILVSIRAEISQNLGEAASARTSAHAEVCRMAENVDRHYNRATNVLAKLQDMMEKYPSSENQVL
jgi:hypothetical protein